MSPLERAIIVPFLYAWVGLAVVTALTLFFVTAPYGRHTRGGWGVLIPSTLGWLIMEAPSPILMVVFFVLGDRHENPVAIVFLALWLFHYVNRAFIFPFRRRGGQKPMPLAISLQAVFFNFVNAWTCGRWLFAIDPPRDVSWFGDPRFLVGLALFFAGWAINFTSDNILMRLRAPGETGYKIPHGGFYRFVSSPNYMGEIVEWCGYALLTFSLGPLGFAVWTAANLAPRAFSNHRWYLQQFPDYPRERRALIPFVA